MCVKMVLLILFCVRQVLPPGEDSRRAMDGKLLRGSAAHKGLLPEVPVSTEGQRISGPVPIARTKRTDAARQPESPIRRRLYLHICRIHLNSPQSLQVLSHI